MYCLAVCHDTICYYPHNGSFGSNWKPAMVLGPRQLKSIPLTGVRTHWDLFLRFAGLPGTCVVLLPRLISRSDFNFSEFQWFWRLQFYFLYKVHHLNVDWRTRLRIVCRVAAFLIIFLLLWVPAILDRLFIWIFPSEEFHWLNKAHEFSVYTQPLSLAVVWCTTSSFLRLVCHRWCAYMWDWDTIKSYFVCDGCVIQVCGGLGCRSLSSHGRSSDSATSTSGEANERISSDSANDIVSVLYVVHVFSRTWGSAFAFTNCSVRWSDILRPLTLTILDLPLRSAQLTGFALALLPFARPLLRRRRTWRGLVGCRCHAIRGCGVGRPRMISMAMGIQSTTRTWSRVTPIATWVSVSIPIRCPVHHSPQCRDVM